MSGYNPGRGQNVYSSIANLNTIPSEYELAMQQQQDGYNMQADLELFQTTQFLDFDMAEMPNQSPLGFGEDLIMPASGLHQQPLGFFDSTEFQIPTYPTASGVPSTNRSSKLHSHTTSQKQMTPQYNSAVSSPSSTSTPSEKRKLDSLIDTSNPDSLEAASRAAAEEDKRRRNTAASARFRVKKKQREAALEKSAKDMTDRLAYLETRVGQLEMENKLLKDLITEKSGKEVDVSSEPQNKAETETSKQAVKKGVGTGEQKADVKEEATPSTA